MAEWYGRNTIDVYVNEYAKQTEEFILGVIEENLTEHGYHQKIEINGANIKAAIEKQIAKKIVSACKIDNVIGGYCPTCNGTVRIKETWLVKAKGHHCSWCGQKLDLNEV